MTCGITYFHILIIGLVVEFVVAIDEARVRFTDDAFLFAIFGVFWLFFRSCDFYLFAFESLKFFKEPIPRIIRAIRSH
ncbi:hypothetical protein N7490_012189 [Penicillium lividum]|nr:hypothetical protein N7490_012189 [Penicillium lividum]